MFFGLLLSLFVIIHSSSASTSDLDALLRLKAYIVDPLNSLESWKFESQQSSAPCSWLGITCGPGNSRVIGIDLNSRNLSGTLSSEIGLLSSLQSLNLAHNNFTGPIPSSIAACSSLKYLNLSDNAFSERIPSGIFSSLQQLQTIDFWINSLSGEIPREVGTSPRLEHLDLGGSYLEGSIPLEICNISTLRYLTLAGNSLTGEIPSCISNLRRLEWIYLGYNQLNGTIPDSVGLLGDTLTHLDLVFNELSGVIPDTVGNLTKLEYLFLYTNHFTGSIPDSIGRSLHRLISLDLSNNSLSGAIPESVTAIPTLEVVNLFQNNLSSSIPAGFSTMPRLKTLALWKNRLTGTVDPALGTATNLTALDLSTNMLTGSIPPSLCANGELFKLILFDNAFSGPIPGSLARCTSLKRVRIQNNRLTGSIPNGFTSLPGLYFLDVSNNLLQFDMMHFLEWSPSLQTLSLSQNRITGNIPSSIFQLPVLVELRLSKNMLQGTIPSGISDAHVLNVLDLSGNALSGSIPTQISECARLNSINLAENQFSGEIPGSISKISTLASLDLSQNMLTGELPTSIISMQSLQYLNVSMNKLHGTIPPSPILNSSCLFGNDLCSSPWNEELGLPACHAHVDRASVVLGWMLGIVASICVALALVYGTLFLLNRRRRYIRPQEWNLVLFHKLRVTSEDLHNIQGDLSVLQDRDGKLFCVKRVKKVDEDSSLIENMEDLSRSRDVNLVKILGIYSGNGESSMILFEHMPLGNLLEDKNKAKLDWDKRYEVCLGMAKGLAVLHKPSRKRGRLLHGSFSCESVFLDADLKPKVLPGLGTNSLDDICSPHIAPELVHGKIITEKTDVYAYGVTVLEIITGKKATDPMFKSSIVDFIRKCIADRGWQAGAEFVDTALVGVCPRTESEIMRVVKLALMCTEVSPAERPAISEVVKMMENARQSLPRSVQMMEIVTE